MHVFLRDWPRGPGLHVSPGGQVGEILHPVGGVDAGEGESRTDIEEADRCEFREVCTGGL